MTLTKKQVEQLVDCAMKPQPHTGRGRVQVQNALINLGLLELTHRAPYQCVASAAGRALIIQSVREQNARNAIERRGA